jgi:hypothetical protein
MSIFLICFAPEPEFGVKMFRAIKFCFEALRSYKIVASFGHVLRYLAI